MHVNIAKETIRIGKDEHIAPIHLLDEMRVKTIKMLKTNFRCIYE